MNRVCGGCTACCKAVPVASLNKRAGERCQHQRTGKGCAIYRRRPIDCVAWSCAWLVDPETADMKRPDRTHYVVDVMTDDLHCTDNETGKVSTREVIQVWCDPAWPDAWRDPALLAYLDAIPKPAIVRFNNDRALLIVPPKLNPAGVWGERDLGPPNPRIGRYASLPPGERPPL